MLIQINIKYIGVEDYYIYEFNKKKIAIFSYTHIPDFKNRELINIWEENEVDKIKEIISKVDFTIVNIHWRNEFINVPSKEQIELGRKLIDNGVNLVLGTHPHVLQPIEKYKNGLIVFSMGNFFFDSFGIEDTLLTAIFKFYIDIEKKSIDYEFFPIKINKDYSIDFADQNSHRIINNLLNSKIIIYKDEIYNKMVLDKRKKYRKKILKHFLFNFRKYEDKIAILKWGIKRILFILMAHPRMVWVPPTYCDVKNIYHYVLTDCNACKIG